MALCKEHLKKNAGVLLEEVKVYPETKLAWNFWLLFVLW